ncbi:carboxypeptidase-like regulatory domain-containing protein, partial [bacterium]|nr:carboxypeptidase-like regulatory domain-containing protein [bacterium]
MKHRHNYILILLLLTLWIGYFVKVQAQPGRGQDQGYAITTGWIKGFVFDSKNNKPVEYANVVLYSKRTQEQVTGTITDPQGFFHLT